MEILNTLYGDKKERYVSDFALVLIKNYWSGMYDSFVNDVRKEDMHVINLYSIYGSGLGDDLNESTLIEIFRNARPDVYLQVLDVINTVKEDNILSALENIPVPYVYYTSPGSIIYRTDNVGNLDVVFLGALMASKKYNDYLSDVNSAIEYPSLHIEKYMTVPLWKKVANFSHTEPRRILSYSLSTYGTPSPKQQPSSIPWLEEL